MMPTICASVEQDFLKADAFEALAAGFPPRKTDNFNGYPSSTVFIKILHLRDCAGSCSL